MSADVFAITQEIVKTVGQRVRALRLAHNLSLRALATRANVSSSTIFNVERCYSWSSLYTMVAIASGLDLRLVDLLDEERFLRALSRAAAGQERGLQRLDRHTAAQAVFPDMVNQPPLNSPQGGGGTLWGEPTNVDASALLDELAQATNEYKKKAGGTADEAET